MEDPNKYDKSQTDSQSNPWKRPPFNRNLSPDETLIARTAAPCFLQGLVMSTVGGFLAYRGTGRYIATQNNAFLKRASTFMKLATGFLTYNAIFKVHARSVCMKRIENLPPSEAKDKFIEKLKSGRRGRPTPLGNDGSNDEPGRGVPHVPFLQQGRNLRYDSQPALSQPALSQPAAAESHNPSIDETPNTSHDRRGVDFDYSKSYRLPPNETRVEGGASKINPRIRRNKYGDVIEED